MSRWLQSQQYRPRDIWHIVKDLINTEEPCLLVVDDTVLDKHRSKQIDLVHHQYSGNAHDVIAGIGLVNLVWYGLERQHSIPIDYRVYDKDTDGKTKRKRRYLGRYFAHPMMQNRRAKRDDYKPSAVRVTQRYVP
ncbi:hypothetical protein GW537_08895 [Piscirickettsia salmonis]|nr:hypothetical protein GW538_07500 [Piscirickettsia salmonis]QHS30574.1 hypothetical protein GW537_08895 [Piscirickettsia salmonis]